MPHKRIGGPLSHIDRSLSEVQRGKRPKWKKRKGESYDHYLGRVGVWLAGQEGSAPAKKKVKSERQRIADERKKTEKQLGIKRGIKKKKK